MPELGRFARELRSRLWKPPVTEEVASEIAAHMELLEQDLQSQGMPAADARREALRRFGDAERIAVECRDLGESRDIARRRTEWWHELRQDLRQALRQLRASRRFTVVAVGTLAVGLGSATTIFAIANAVMLRPLPFPAADRLVLVHERNPVGQRFAMSESNYLDYNARNRSFTSLAIFQERSVALVMNGEPERLRGAVATHSFFPALGMAPLLGRGFLPEEDRRGGDFRVAVLGHGVWTRRFGADPGLVGRMVELDGVAHRIVGVMPAGFDFPNRTDVWVPLVPSTEFHRDDRRNEAVGRLKPAVTLEQARQEMQAIAAQLASEFPRENGQWSADLGPFKEWFVSPQLGRRVLALLAAVVLLLGMACVNVANLLLARAAARDREMAVRAALGAGRWRMVRQLLTESLVLSLSGAVGGALLTALAVPMMRRVGSVTIPRLAELSIDWRVVGFALPACVLTGLIFGLAPVLRLAGGGVGGDARLHDVLRSGTRVAESGRWRQSLVVVSVALAMTMLVAAGLVGTSFRKLMGVELGFSADHVVLGNVDLPDGGYDFERTIIFYSEAIRRLQGVPGVKAVGASNIAPLTGGNTGMEFTPAEQAEGRRDAYRLASWRTVTPGYFASLEIPLKRGRHFTADDRYRPDMDGRTDRVIIVNERLASVAWPGEDPIGRRLLLGSGNTMTVVGVVGDTRHLTLDSLPSPAMYFAHAQFPWRSMWFTVRTEGDPAATIAALRREVAALDPLLPLAGVRPMLEVVSESAAEPRLTMLVFGIFATSALVLAAAGLYGVVSYSVSRRSREIGVAIALGAQPGRVVREVLGNGVRLAVLGVGLGAVVAVGVAGALRAILYATEPTDLVTYAGVALLLVVVAAAASAFPARRAAQLDPVVALRGEG